MHASEAVPASFRDPSGFVYEQDGVLYRQVNLAYREHYDLLLSSGLYQGLVADGLLIAHEEVSPQRPPAEGAYKVLRPERVPFISYPYEWSFSQLKDAALATLRIQQRALACGLSLKDCSAYNIQFMGGKPLLIDTLSFERYREGAPWIAYRQFCQHFLAPLALMSYRDVRLGQLLRTYIDGVPLSLASRLLPASTRFRFSLLTHIHLHAQSEARYGDKPVDVSRHRIERPAFLALVENLEAAVAGLKWRPRGAWAGYYAATNYGPAALEHKAELVSSFVDAVTPAPRLVWDLGANTGRFSRIAAGRGALTVAFDSDPACVEGNYLDCARDGETHVLPLLVDLTNPSPAIGWANEERASLAERGPADLALALALIHHLAIGNNLPLARIAAFLRRICRALIVEFVPKSDSQVQRLLATRDDIFPGYAQQAFEEAFARCFRIVRSAPIRDSERTLYLMVREGEE
ncbi:MAG TPA: SAM-dependent methyltransferase [Anaerolineae bacterium]|nr:SAM-dependent methyltransferase [Anaerolineae bacterium]HPL28074.1 SAM-dependent methyltransferase [Anaerolineae bacterium]